MGWVRFAEPPAPLLLLFSLQTAFALLGASAVWRDRPRGALAVLLLGATIAATELVEAFVLGIVAYLWALLIAVLAIVVAVLIAAYVGLNRGGS